MGSIKPTIYLTPAVKEKLDLYIEHSNTEISGIGNITINNNILIVDDIYLLEQKNTSVETNINSEEFSKFCTELVRDGKSIEGLKFWWHSHVNMNTFWSPQDEKAIETLETDFLISIVGNKKGEYLARIDTFVPYRSSIDELPIKILSNPELSEAIKKEISEKTVQVETGGYWYGQHRGGKKNHKNDRYLMNSLLDNGFYDSDDMAFEDGFGVPDYNKSLADFAKPSPGSALNKMDNMGSYKSGNDGIKNKPTVKVMNGRHR